MDLLLPFWVGGACRMQGRGWLQGGGACSPGCARGTGLARETAGHGARCAQGGGLLITFN
jgi:hypothetical protein